MEIQTEILDMPPFPFRQRLRVFIESTTIFATEPPECGCPEGLAEFYNVPDPLGENPGDTLTLVRAGNGSCNWCGWSFGEVDERKKYQLYINTDPGCGWFLSIDEGTTILSKAWGGGDPTGEYTGDLTTTVSEGAGTVNIPC